MRPVLLLRLGLALPFTGLQDFGPRDSDAIVGRRTHFAFGDVLFIEILERASTRG